MINIIGAGPAGSYLAYLLAKEGKQVNLFEEHSKIGSPIQCTGIVTSYIEKILPFDLDGTIINKIEDVKIFAPNKKYIQLKLKERNIILDRKKFDQLLADKAKKAGANIFLEHKFIKKDNGHIYLKNKDKIKIIKSGFLIGADGPMSSVAKSANFFGKRKFMAGMQARVKLKNDNAVEFYPFIGSFGWIVPENKSIVRIGVASYKNVRKNFEYLLDLKKIRKKSIIDKQAGLIPIYNPRIKTQKDDIFLVGDAATHLKATTGGGIVQGIVASKCLAKSIINRKDYKKLWKKELSKELWLHLKLREIMDKFSEKDWNLLIHIFNKKSNKKILENFERDHLTRFIIRLALKEPMLWYFSRYII